LAETFRAGPRGAAHDLRLTTADWGIPFQEVSAPVALWHGDADLEVTPGKARRLVDALPHGSLHPVAGGGHHLGLSHPGPLLEALTS
jgi:pimeloyl-ACP methyl ester carboxylesterase